LPESYLFKQNTRFTLLIIAAMALLGLSLSPIPAETCDPTLACFEVGLSPATLLGDIYVNGNLIVAGVNISQLSLSPNPPYLIEVRNIQDTTPGFGDLFIYPDQSRTNPSALTGRIYPITFRPIKQYLKGVLEITCDPRGRKVTDMVVCRPTIDGVSQADIAAGAKATYLLASGPHTVHTELIGDQANNWSPTLRDDTILINAGRSSAQTTYLRATFTLKGLLKILVLPKGLIADLYLNGSLLASQVSGLDIYVAPGAYTVEAQAVTDPSANGLYMYANASRSGVISAAGVRYAYVSPQKTWLKGFLNLNCQINRKGLGDDAYCLVTLDGSDLGTVTAGQRSTFNLPLGAHTLSVSVGGASAGKWDGPKSTTVTIVGGRTTAYTARFNLLPLPTATLILPATPTPALTLFPNERLAQGTHLYMGSSCNTSYNQRNITFTFLSNDQVTVNGSLTGSLPYTRAAQDVWVFYPSIGGKFVITFLDYGFTQYLDGGGCETLWRRLD
jgi:hypothetical protein